MEHQAAAPLDRILSRAEFRELTGLSRTSEWRLAKDGKTPSPVIIDGRIIGYRKSSYLLWLEAHTT